MATDVLTHEIKITITGFDSEEIVFSNLNINQSIASHHHFNFIWRIGAFQSDPDIQSKVMDYIGKDVSITMASSIFKGIITEISIEERNDGQVIHIAGQSPTILLEDAPRSTSYYKQNLKSIVQKSVADFSGNLLKENINPAYTDEIHYLAQYNETDFQFLKRLAVRYGEWFYFDGEKLQFGELQNSNKTLRNNIEITELVFQSNLQANKYSYTGMDSHKGKKIEDNMADLKYSGDGFTKVAVEKSKSIFSRKDPKRSIHVMNTSNKKQLDIIKLLDSKAAVARAMTIRGQSFSPELRPGYRFKIDLRGNTPEFIVTNVVHHSLNTSNYTNSFTAVSAKIEVPPYTNPHVVRKSEMQPAIIVDNKDSDKLGRLKVKFPWTDLSPWIRMSAPHSGKDKGWHFIPEIGEDVMIDFEGGDVDKPFIIGSLYHGNSKSGLGDNNNDIKSLKTRSGNTIILNDKDGSITIKDAQGSVLILKGDDTIELTSKTKIVIKSKDIDIKADNSINISAGGSLNIKSGGDMALNSQSNMKQDSLKEFKISSKDNLETSSLKDTKIKATMNMSIEGTMKTEVKGLQTSIQGTVQTEVKGAMVMIN